MEDLTPLERFQRGLTTIHDIAYNDAVQVKSPFWNAYKDLMWLARVLGVQPEAGHEPAIFNRASFYSYFEGSTEDDC